MKSTKTVQPAISKSPTANHALKVATAVCAQLVKAGLPASVQPSNTRVGVKVKGHKPALVFGFNHPTGKGHIAISCPYFTAKNVANLVKEGATFTASRVPGKGYNVVRGRMQPQAIQASVLVALKGLLTAK